MNISLLTSEIRTDSDVVFARQRAKQIAALLGFDPHEQTRISTAVSEIARNCFLYATEGRALFSVEGHAAPHLMIRIRDRGPGIVNLPTILAGQYVSRSGMGLGLLGAQRLMDIFRVDSVPGVGATVELGKALPALAAKVTPDLVVRIGAALAEFAPTSATEELREQNSALLRALDELRTRKIELDGAYQELADANRGILASVIQLEDRADALNRMASSERAARAVAETAVATRDLLLAVVSHDLRTPLSVIVTCAGILQRTLAAGPESEYTGSSVQAILRSADRMTAMIGDLLDLAQIEAGQVAVIPVLQDVEGLLRDCLEMLAPLALRKNLRSISSPGLLVNCDRGRVLQVLSNLVGNAIKFTPDGGSIVIDVQDAVHEVRFSVRDSGRGISEEELPRIFDRFWQSGTKNRAGVGLGLSIAKGLVEAHGGRLYVESTFGAGATFFFTLPFEPSMHTRIEGALTAN